MFGRFFRGRRAFEKVFGFNPRHLSERRSQQEALIRLAQLATSAHDAARNLAVSPRNRAWEKEYRKTSRRYLKARQLVQKYNTELGRRIPHWTELPAFLREWLGGEKVEVPTPPFFSDSKIVDLDARRA